MGQREVYRRKDGRFASRRDLLQGPPTPRHIIDQEWRNAMKRAHKAALAQVTARNGLLDLIEVR